MTDWDGMSEDEIQARIEEMHSVLQLRAAIEETEQIERAAVETPAFSWPPMPGTEHPWMERSAATVRHFMAEGRHTVAVAPPRTPHYRFISAADADPMEPPPDPVILNVRRVAAPAPWSGEPFAYMWRVAVDNMNRWVADDAQTVPGEPKSWASTPWRPR
jgi:hypothetical protein